MMKKILAAALIGILFFGCGKKASDKPEDYSAKMKTDTSEIKTVPVNNPDRQFNFQYKFQKGETFQYRITSSEVDKITDKMDSAVTRNMNVSIIYLLDFTVSSIDKDGTTELSCTIPSILSKADNGMQKVFYQSGVTKDSSDLAKFAEYEALINNPFSVRIGKNGGVLEVFRADRMVDKFLQLKKPPQPPTPEQKNQLRTSIVESGLKPLVSQIFRDFPTNKMAKDSSWTVAQPPAPFLIFKLENTSVFKVSGLEKYNEDTLAVINAGVNSVISGNTKYEERGATYNFKKPETSVNGTIYFDLTSGRLRKAKTESMFHIFFTMEAPGPKGKQKGSEDKVTTTSNIIELL